MGGDGAVAADVVVIAHVDETTGEMVALELLGGVVPVFAGGGAVDDEVFHRGGGHINARLHIGKKIVLVGDRVASYRQRIAFNNHIVVHLIKLKKIIVRNVSPHMMLLP